MLNLAVSYAKPLKRTPMASNPVQSTTCFLFNKPMILLFGGVDESASKCDVGRFARQECSNNSTKSLFLVTMQNVELLCWPQGMHLLG